MLHRCWRPLSTQLQCHKVAYICCCPASEALYSTQQQAKKPVISQKVRFIDQLRVVARGGQGGGGSSALFGRTGHHPRAAGGNGAPGGAVLLRATKQLTGLGSIPLHVEGARGGHGGKQWMDGKRGADKVIQVPLGTLVSRLVQLRGGNADKPHGITSLPRTAAQQAQHSTTMQLQPHGIHSPSQLFRAHQDSLSGQMLNKSSQEVYTGNASTFQQQEQGPLHQGQRQHGYTADAAGLAQASPAPHGWSEQDPAASLRSSSDVSGSSNNNRVWTDPQSNHDAASGLQGGVVGAEDTEGLYQQLISCRRLLSNAEKLQLLHFGRLGGPTSFTQGAGVDADNWGHNTAAGIQDYSDNEEFDDDDDSSESEDMEAGDEDEWEMNGHQQRQAAKDWGALGEHGPAEDRHFTKQQVWSILEAQAELVGELDTEAQQLLVAAGGRGGKGNAVAHSTPQRPASRTRSDGQPGQEVLLLLKLRLLADIVLVGLPNVGKSSLIAALTGARAQIGSYAFTTLRPQLGAMTTAALDSTAAEQPSSNTPAASDADSSSSSTMAAAAELTATDMRSGSSTAVAATAAAAAVDESAGGLSGSHLVLADLPGLVPGAHVGRGRGTDFLKHLQRARCIALVLDMTGHASRTPEQGQEQGHEHSCVAPAALSEGQWAAVVPYGPVEQLAILQEELHQYDANILEIPMLVIANKVDAMSPEAATKALEQLKAATPLPIVPVSAKEHLGLQRLKHALQLVAGA